MSHLRVIIAPRRAHCPRCTALLTVVVSPHPHHPHARRCCAAARAFAAPPRSCCHVCPIVVPSHQQLAHRRCVLVATTVATAVAVAVAFLAVADCLPLAYRHRHRACCRRRAAMSAVVALPCLPLSVAAARGRRPRAPGRRAIVCVPPGHAEPPGLDVPGRCCRACRRRRAIMSTVVALLCLPSSVAAARGLRRRALSRRAMAQVPPGHDMLPDHDTPQVATTFRLATKAAKRQCAAAASARRHRCRACCCR